MKRIPVAGPWITQKEVDYVADAARRSWYEDANLYTERFEKAFAEWLGVRHAIALPSCTSAIHLSLVALGVGSGDEVIVPDITWIATAAPITYVGATPVFADIDAASWCIAPDSLEECISPKTRAVLPVDLYGNLPDMDAVTSIARTRGIAMIEDAAEALGSEQRGRKAGSFGDIGVFSFHGSKTVTTGEGGMLVTDRTDVYERVQALSDHGRKPGDRMFWNTEVAFKYRMSGVQAALGLAQLERVEELLARKREIFSWYQQELAGEQRVLLNAELPGTRNSYWMVTAVVDSRIGIEKTELIQRLEALGIGCRPFFYPLSSLPAYRTLDQAHEAQRRNRIAHKISPYGVNLPSALNLTVDHVRRVCTALKEILDSPSDRSTGAETASSLPSLEA